MGKSLVLCLTKNSTILEVQIANLLIKRFTKEDTEAQKVIIVIMPPPPPQKRR